MSTLTVDARPLRPAHGLRQERDVKAAEIPSASVPGASIRDARGVSMESEHTRLRQQLDNAVERMNDSRLSLAARWKYLHELRRIRGELDRLEQEGYGTC